MANYPRSAYGASNPNAGRPANGDRNAWGGYSWPGGVPSSKLGTAQGRALNGQALTITVRREIVPLWNLLFQIAVKHNYQIWASKNGEAWGPWSYSNRAVSGTNYASGHSMGLSVDINAPYNPYSYTFQSDMPPAMVKDFEACGMYWGGRYQGQKYDAMHFGYCFGPGSVAGHIAKARSILGQKPAPAPKPPTGGTKPSTSTGIPKPKKTATYNPSGKKPSYPLSGANVFGVVTGPKTQHSGDPRYDNENIRKNIRTIQSYLNAVGWYTGKIDGLFGSSTEAVVKRFQKAYTGPTGKLSADGIVGSKTWNAMGLRT